MTVTSPSNDWNAADRANEPIGGSRADVAEERERSVRGLHTHTHTHRDDAEELLEEERHSHLTVFLLAEKRSGRFIEPSVTDGKSRLTTLRLRAVIQHKHKNLDSFGKVERIHTETAILPKQVIYIYTHDHILMFKHRSSR